MEDINLKKIEVFENYRVERAEFGHVVLSTEVIESSLNYYEIAGLVSISTGFEAVTLQSNINYFKPGKAGQRLYIHGKCVHNGKTTKVIDIEIRNEEDQLLTKNSCTMFVTGTSDRGIPVDQKD